MANTEPAFVQKYWSKVSADELREPNVANVEFVYDLDGKDPRVCCLYLIHDQYERCYVISQEKMDNSDFFGTTHIKALQHYIHRFGYLGSGQKFNYIIGFYYEVGEHKLKSCANYFFEKTRHMSQQTEQLFKKNIFPKIDKMFANTITQCQGLTKKSNFKLKCKRLLKKQLYCKSHDPNKNQ